MATRALVHTPRRAQLLDKCRARRIKTDKIAFLPPDKHVRTLAEYQISGAQFNPTQCLVASGLSEKEWMRIGRAIAHVSTATKWWLGDWMIAGAKLYGVRVVYDLAVQATGKDRQNLRCIKQITACFPAARRRAELSFQHHMEVASLTETDQDELLQMAVDLGLTCHQLNALVAKRRKSNGQKWHIVPVPMHERLYQSLLSMAGTGSRFGSFLSNILERHLIDNGQMKTLDEIR